MRKKYPVVFLTAITIIILDQLSKFLVKINFNLNESVPVMGEIFHLTYIHNFGAGFGILQNQRILLVIISIAVAAFIFYYAKKVKEEETLLQLLLGFVLGGTIGNLIDRIFLVYVTDFFDFMIWPVFNIADSFVTIGIIGLVIYFWRK